MTTPNDEYNEHAIIKYVCKKMGVIMNNLKIEQLQEAYDKIYYNAQELIKDSKLLFDNNRIPRAFTLSHLAIEELAKLPMVYHTATCVFYKQPVDWKTFRKRFQSHEEKLKSATLLINMVMQRDIDKKVLDELLQFVKVANDLKNHSLYTSFVENKFLQPSESVSKQSAEASYQLANKLLDFFSLKGFHGKNGIQTVLKNTTLKEFQKTQILSDKNVLYSPDGKVQEYYKSSVYKLKQNRKKRSKKKKRR